MLRNPEKLDVGSESCASLELDVATPEELSIEACARHGEGPFRRPSFRGDRR